MFYTMLLNTEKNIKTVNKSQFKPMYAETNIKYF